MDLELDRPRWRSTLTYALHPRVQLGVELNLAAEEVGPLATVFLATETERRPAVFLGTSSDRIGSPEGTQSYYVTASKRLPRLPLSIYGSVNYSEWDDGINFPAGVEVDLGRGFSVRPMYDGQRSHLMLNWQGERFGASLLYVWYERLGVAFFTGF